MASLVTRLAGALQVLRSIRLMILAAIIPGMLIVVGSVLYALYQPHALSMGFSDFVDRDLRRMQAYSVMLGRGMNSGQGIRSLILDNNDQEAATALKSAHQSFANALAEATAMAEPGLARAASLAQVAA